MSDSEKLALAAHLHVMLRRKSGRVTDTEWMAQNAEYAHEVLRVARAESDAELASLADRFEQLMFGTAAASAQPDATTGQAASEKPESLLGRYVGSLR